MIRFQSRFKICWLRKDKKKKQTNERSVNYQRKIVDKKEVLGPPLWFILRITISELLVHCTARRAFDYSLSVKYQRNRD